MGNTDTDDNTERKQPRSNNVVMTFLERYGLKRRQGLLDDAKLSLGQYAMKIGLIFAFLIFDLIFFPSIIQLLVPLSTSFFIICLIGISILAYAEKKTLDRVFKVENQKIVH